MKASVISLFAVAGLATVATAQPVVNYSIERWAVTDFAHDSVQGTFVAEYAGGRDNPGRLLGSDNSDPSNWINEGESLLLRVRMNMPTFGQTTGGPGGSSTLRGFGAANFDVSFGNGLGGSTWAGSAPISPALFDAGVTTAWEDLVENIESFYGSTSSPNTIDPTTDAINGVTVAQIPGFTSPINNQNNPWVVDLIWTPSTYAERDVTYTFSAGEGVTTLFGTSAASGNWVEVASTLASATGSVHVVPAPASLALLGLGGLVAGRRRR